MNYYQMFATPISVIEADDEEDALQQAMSYLEEGSVDVAVTLDEDQTSQFDESLFVPTPGGADAGPALELYQRAFSDSLRTALRLGFKELWLRPITSSRLDAAKIALAYMEKYPLTSIAACGFSQGPLRSEVYTRICDAFGVSLYVSRPEKS